MHMHARTQPTSPTVKKFEFQKPKTVVTAILKTVKSPYLSNRLTNFDEIWHGYWPPLERIDY